MSRPLVSLHGVTLALGGRTLLGGVDCLLKAQDRVCLVGRNGAGKSTLLRLLAGRLEPDSGERRSAPRVLVSYLEQEPALDPAASLEQQVLAGLPASERDQRNLFRARELLEALAMDPSRPAEALSGGERRRVSIARALVADPDVLLLDEPTNHLDLPAIEWLEQRLERFPGAMVVISHDRRFLATTGRITWWLDRGELRVNDAGYATFEDWREGILLAEEQERQRIAQKIKAEQRWLHRGVTARRRRNQGRLARLEKLRTARARLLRNDASASMRAEHQAGGGACVIEAESIGKRFGETLIVDGFSTRIMRGDRIGVIGRNGIGKTTLLRLLLGELEPDSGTVRLGTNLAVARFDQQRSALDEAATPWSLLCPDGGDRVVTGGRSRHVVGYLQDFLFRDEQARMPIAALSGGERSRLLLALVLTRPSNLLVLDEPTNDLDIETLDLLEELLADYAGTVLLVSHERRPKKAFAGPRSLDLLGSVRLPDPDMPGLEAHAQAVVERIADIDIAEFDQALEHFRLGELFGEVALAPAHQADVEVADAVKGIARRCQRARGQRQIASMPAGLGEKQMHLLDDAADAGGQDHLRAELLADLRVDLLWLSPKQVVARARDLDDVLAVDLLGQVLERLAAEKAVLAGVFVEQLLEHLGLVLAEAADLRVASGIEQDLVESDDIEVGVADDSLRARQPRIE